MLFRSDSLADTAVALVAVEEVLSASCFANSTAFAMELLLFSIEVKQDTDFTKVATEKNSTLLAVFLWILNKITVHTFYLA